MPATCVGPKDSWDASINMRPGAASHRIHRSTHVMTGPRSFHLQRMAPRPGRASLRRVLEHCCAQRAAPAAAATALAAAVASASATAVRGASTLLQQHQPAAPSAPMAPPRHLRPGASCSLGGVRGIMHRAGQPAGWAKTAADASLDVIVDAVTRPKARKEVGVFTWVGGDGIGCIV